MKLHSQFERDTKTQKYQDTWNFLPKGDLKRETENLIFASRVKEEGKIEEQWRTYVKWRPWQSLNVRPFLIIYTLDIPNY